ncbi:hypothetical protein [Sodalis sp.]
MALILLSDIANVRFIAGRKGAEVGVLSMFRSSLLPSTGNR